MVVKYKINLFNLNQNTLMGSVIDFHVIHTYEIFEIVLNINARLGILPHKANVVKHVRVENYSQSGRQLLQLLKSPSTLCNEGN